MSGKRQYLAYRSFWPEPETTRSFYDAGFRCVCFLAGNTCNSLGQPYGKYPMIWAEDKAYEFEHLDQQIEDILRSAPDAELICMIDLNTPFWYVRKHCTNARAYDSFDQLGRTASSELWRQDTCDYLEAFLRYTERKYGKRIAAYVLAGGSTCEWIDRTRGEESEHRLKAWKQYCTARDLPEPDDIPPRSVRNHVSADALRDPETDAFALRYWHFANANIRETVQLFLQKARTVLDEYRKDVELGTFFGYIMHMGNESWNCGGGHLDYEQLFASPELDFIISPGVYHDRGMGGGCGSQTPILSLTHYDKRYLYECDQRTYCANENIAKYTKISGACFNDEQETLAGLKRELAFSLIHQSSMWYFDMWGGFYQGKKVFSLLKDCAGLWNRFAEKEMPDRAEILLVVDPESMLYVDFTNISSYDYCTFIQAKLNKTGAPYRVCSTGDLEWMAECGRLDDYKLIVMANQFAVDEKKLAVLNKHVLCKNRTVIWQYLAGISRNGKKDRANVELLTGISAGISGTETRIMNGWKSILAATPADLTPELIRHAGEDAGVHFYAPLSYVVYGNGDLFAVHSGAACEVGINLPDGCSEAEELFSGVRHQGNMIHCKSNGPETWLFRLTDQDKCTKT